MAQGQSFFMASGDAGQYDQTAKACQCSCTNTAGGATTETLFVCSGAPCPNNCAPPPPGSLPPLACAITSSVTLDGPITTGDMRAEDNITLVGGTALSLNAGAYNSETAAPFSGGGLIAGTALPDYQTNVPGINQAGRNSPDVAMPAVNLYVVSTGCAVSLVNGQCPVAQLSPNQASSVGGTSSSAPLWAGFMALINQQGSLQTPQLQPVGFANEAFYGILSSGAYASAFHDISGGPTQTQGVLPTQCGNGATPSPNWDAVTGLGSPNGCGLITAVDALATPPQATVVLSGINFHGTGFNVCSSCSGSNCDASIQDPTSIDCRPDVGANGALTAHTIKRELACDNQSGSHGAYITITCAPTTTVIDGGNGTASRGLDVTVALGLESSCGDNNPTNQDTFTATNVLPGTPQQANKKTCNFFGANDFPCFAQGDGCNYNSFSAGVTVSNTGGFVRQ
ncbi:MAG: hypothetical protein ACRENE_03525 [Polyangiaceae bacterium]